MTLKQKELKIENQNLKKAEEIEESLKVVFSYTLTLMCNYGKVLDTNFVVYT